MCQVLDFPVTVTSAYFYNVLYTDTGTILVLLLMFFIYIYFLGEKTVQLASVFCPQGFFYMQTAYELEDQNVIIHELSHAEFYLQSSSEHSKGAREHRQVLISFSRLKIKLTTIIIHLNKGT